MKNMKMKGMGGGGAMPMSKGHSGGHCGHSGTQGMGMVAPKARGTQGSGMVAGKAKGVQGRG